LNVYTEDGQCTTGHKLLVTELFGQHFVNIEDLLNGMTDLYKIWWQYSKYIKACAC